MDTTPPGRRRHRDGGARAPERHSDVPVHTPPAQKHMDKHGSDTRVNPIPQTRCPSHGRQSRHTPGYRQPWLARCPLLREWAHTGTCSDTGTQAHTPSAPPVLRLTQSQAAELGSSPSPAHTLLTWHGAPDSSLGQGPGRRGSVPGPERSEGLRFCRRVRLGQGRQRLTRGSCSVCPADS